MHKSLCTSSNWRYLFNYFQFSHGAAHGLLPPLLWFNVRSNATSRWISRLGLHVHCKFSITLSKFMTNIRHLKHFLILNGNAKRECKRTFREHISCWQKICHKQLSTLYFPRDINNLGRNTYCF